MSYRFEYKGKKYWIKEFRDKTEIHYNIGKGCSDNYTINADSSPEDFNKAMVLIDKLNEK